MLLVEESVVSAVIFLDELFDSEQSHVGPSSVPHTRLSTRAFSA